jgi:hypothetical protein
MKTTFHLTPALRLAVISLNKLNLQLPNETSYTVVNKNTFSFCSSSATFNTLYLVYKITSALWNHSEELQWMEAQCMK